MRKTNGHNYQLIDMIRTKDLTSSLNCLNLPIYAIYLQSHHNKEKVLLKSKPIKLLFDFCQCFLFSYVIIQYWKQALFILKFVIIMGTSESSSSTQGINDDKIKRLKFIYGEIDKFYTNQLTKNQFINQLFFEMQRSRTGFVVCNTYLLERFYVLMVQESNRPTINCTKLKGFIQKIFKDTDKAIQRSFGLLDIDGDRRVSKAQFLNFMDNCFVSVLNAAQKNIDDHNFRINFKDWVNKHRKQFFDATLRIFEKYKRSDPNYWNMADYKRWVLSGENWTLDLQLGTRKYKIPLNLLSLFVIPSN